MLHRPTKKGRKSRVGVASSGTRFVALGGDDDVAVGDDDVATGGEDVTAGADEAAAGMARDMPEPNGMARGMEKAAHAPRVMAAIAGDEQAMEQAADGDGDVGITVEVGGLAVESDAYAQAAARVLGMD